MRRQRRVWRRPSEPSPLDRATSVGLALPSFNFIEPKMPKRPPATAETLLPSLSHATRNQSPAKDPPALDGDAIVYHTLLRYAHDLDEPTMSEESKVTRLWQSLQRHSEAGRFSSQLAAYAPNPICALLAMEIVQQILETSGVSLLLINLLVGALGNSIFLNYEPDKPTHDLTQYADKMRELDATLSRTSETLAACKKQSASHKSQLAAFALEERESSTEDKARLVTAVYRSVEDQGLVSALILETLVPFFNDELLLLLWNAMATVSATQRLTQERLDLVENDNDNDTDDDNDATLAYSPATRKRASILAARVLHERVRLMLLLWQTLSVEEKDAVATSLTTFPEQPHGTSSSSLGLKSVLQTLEEVYVSEQVRGRASPRRSMFLSPAARRTSVVVHQEGLTRSQRLTIVRPTVASTLEPAPPNVSIPDVLLGALAQEQHEAATPQSQLIMEQLANDRDEILRQCEEIFDGLCEDPTAERNGARKPALDVLYGDAAGAQAIVAVAKERLCDLLSQYVDAPSFILEKFEHSEAQRAMREAISQNDDVDGATAANAVVHMLIQRQRHDPTILATAINQHPEILLSAIATNNGILRFAMTKFAPLVKRFLRLDLKACDYLDQLAQKHKGIQLLWGTNTASASATPLQVHASVTGRRSVSDVLDDVLAARKASSVMKMMADSSGSRSGVVLSPSEMHLLEWFQAHTDDLAWLSLKKPDVLKPLLVEMHTVGDVATFHKVMLQLASTKGFQAFVQRSSLATLEKITQEDPAEVARLLREIFSDSGNQDLLHQLRSSPYLVTCLSEFHPTLIHDVMASDLETWHHYFVETVSANDAMLKEILVTRTEQLDGGETLVRLFSAVVAGETAGLNLHALDFGASPLDVALARTRDGLSRRKQTQCLYLRGGASVFRALVAPLIATVGFQPHEMTGFSTMSPHSRTHASHASTVATTHSSASRGKVKKAARALSGSPAKKRPPPLHAHPKKDDATTASDGLTCSTSDSVPACQQETLVESMPLLWRSFALLYLRHQRQQHAHRDSVQLHAPVLTLAHAKTLLLDLWIEFLKIDTVQLDATCLYSLAPFVCDYLVTRYDSHVVVGAWIVALSDAMASFYDDPRVAFFASSCGFHTSPSGDGYDTFLYYAHALGHLLFGHMKVFKPDCRLEETVDGSCPVEKRFVIATAARLFDHRLLSGPEIDALLTRLEKLPPMDTQGRVELDDAMSVFLDQWRLVNTHVDERYRQAFASYDPTGSNRIGLEQFIKIVTCVAQQSISPRECLLVFCDVGQELLDVETLVRVTRVYHLRLFNSHLPEIPLDEADLQELALSVGRTNIFSLAREVEDLHRFWKGLCGDVHAQMEALHQSKNTKMQLKKQSALLEKLLQEITTNLHAQPQPPASSGGGGGGGGGGGRPRSQQQQQQRTLTGPQMLHKAWTELRACAKMLQSAKLTQHYLSRLYIQTCIVRWVRLMRKTRLEREQQNQTLRHGIEGETFDPPSSHADL